MTIVTQGYGCGGTDRGENIICGVSNVGCSPGSSPNMNYQLLVDGQEISFFNSVSINKTISSLSGFSINLGNPNNCKSHRFKENSVVEFKATWGNNFKTQILGFIKKRNFRMSTKRELVVSGIDYGDYMLRKRAWENRNPIQFYNEKASVIIETLLGFVPELKLQISKKRNEPRMDYQTDPTGKYILDELKTVAEYAGYRWFISGNILYVFERKSLTNLNSRYNLILGSKYDYMNLPELPYVSLLDASVDEDGGSIRNAYYVTGSEGISSYYENQQSIREYSGLYEGYYSDSRITSVQTCRLVAKELADINGYPRISIGVAHRGTEDMMVGDVVSIGDSFGGFDLLDSPYLEVVSISSEYGKTWKSSTTLGRLEPSLSDVLR